jgi:hypothetical protein
MTVSRWLTWTPGRSNEITDKQLEPEPSKLPKPGFEGFGGSRPGKFSVIEQRFHYHNGNVSRNSDRPRREALDPLWGDPCSCGGRDWRRKGWSPNLQCLDCGRVVHSDYLHNGAWDESRR